MKIVSIGEITIDHYINQERSHVGGISLNYAVQAKRCGADKVSLVSCVGTDGNGRRVLETLTQEGVDISHIAVMPGKTATCDIEIDDRAERIYPSGGYHRNVLADLQLHEADRVFIHQHDILVTLFDRSQPFSFFRQLLTELDFEGKRVVDFGDWSDYGEDYGAIIDCLDNLDLAFVSGKPDTVDALLPISRQMKGLVVVTLGGAGSASRYRAGVLYTRPPVPYRFSWIPLVVAMPFRPPLALLIFVQEM